MALARTKPNVNNELFHHRYSELSDEVRTKNKREDRLLDVRLKYYEREKQIRLRILRKEQSQLERIRTSLMEQLNRIQGDRRRQFLAAYFPEKTKTYSPLLQLSTPNLFDADWEPIANQLPSQTIATQKPVTPKKIVRPHSAG